jgi:hypothetical protein
MKRTALKIAVATAVAALFALIPSSCTKEKQFGEMSVNIKDSPALYSKVNVEVVGMQLHSESEGWINIPVNTGIYDLLDLQNGVSAVLAQRVQVPMGKLTQLRLILGTNNSVTDQTGTYPLTVPSGAETGLKVDLNTTITTDRPIEVLLDFDANASVVVAGSGKFQLKPVIKVESVIQQ